MKIYFKKKNIYLVSNIDFIEVKVNKIPIFNLQKEQLFDMLEICLLINSTRYCIMALFVTQLKIGYIALSYLCAYYLCNITMNKLALHITLNIFRVI